MRLKAYYLILILPLAIFMSGCPDDASEEVICDGGTTKSSLSVMTYNVHLFDVAHAVTRVPFLKIFLQDLVDTYLVSTNSKLADFRDLERAGFIADRILSLNNTPDVLVFTELWSGDLSTELEKRLKPLYPFQYDPDANQYIFDGKIFGNGLVLFSKYPLIPGTDEFNAFNQLTGFDNFTVKGVAQVAIQICEGPRVAVFLTHTQASYGDSPENNQITLNNIVQMAAKVNQYQQSHPEHGILIVGDLNISETGPSYTGMVETLGATDAYRRHYPDAIQYPGYTYDAKANGLISLFTDVNATALARERFDYIFFREGDAISGISSVSDGNPSLAPLDAPIKSSFDFVDAVTGRKLPLSDHYPVRVDFALKTS